MRNSTYVNSMLSVVEFKFLNDSGCPSACDFTLRATSFCTRVKENFYKMFDLQLTFRNRALFETELDRQL